MAAGGRGARSRRTRRGGRSSGIIGLGTTSAAYDATGFGMSTLAARIGPGIGSSRRPSITKHALDSAAATATTNMSRWCFGGISAKVTQGRGPSRQDAATIQS